MVNKKFVLPLIIFLIILISNSAYAITVRATVKVEPFHSAFVQVANPESRVAIAQHYNQSTDITGTTKFEFKTSLKSVSFFVKSVHPLSKAKLEEWIEDLPIKTEMLVDLTEGKYNNIPQETEKNQESENNQNETSGEQETATDTAEVQITVENSDETQNEEELGGQEIEEQELGKISEINPAKSGVTGFFISDETGKVSSYVYYMGIAIILGALALFVIARLKKHPISFLKLKKSPETLAERLNDAQKRIREAESEIRKIKREAHTEIAKESEKERQIKQAQEEFEKARQKLESARRGENLP